MSDRLIIEDVGKSISIRYRWFELTGLTLGLGFLLLALAVGLAVAVTKSTDSSPWLFIFFWVIFAYCYAARLFNSTVIEIDEKAISVSCTPLPWLRKLRIDRSTVRAVFARRRVDKSSSRDGNLVSVWGEVLARISEDASG